MRRTTLRITEAPRDADTVGRHNHSMQFIVMNEQADLKRAWKVDKLRCTGCGDCVAICPVGVLDVRDKMAVMIDEASCCAESCRICEYHCPEDAIRAY